LAIAHLLRGRGQIFVHDPRSRVLQNAKKRFQRVGVTNVQYHDNDEVLSRMLERKVDWVILDVPCTGTGTIRRNPDIKLKYSE
jgi:16S rRNA C967 or C1407 C5-methylase (RsmB/RsmF family)